MFRYQRQMDEDKEPRASKVVPVIYNCLIFNPQTLR